VASSSCRARARWFDFVCVGSEAVSRRTRRADACLGYWFTGTATDPLFRREPPPLPIDRAKQTALAPTWPLLAHYGYFAGAPGEGHRR
jgi:hypothetical protein